MQFGNQANRAYGTVTWRGKRPLDVKNARPLNRDEIEVKRTVATPLGGEGWKKGIHQTYYTISKPEEDGDGTVPKRSGSAVKNHTKAYFELLRVGHEPAYKNQNAHAQRAALYGIIKIAQRIKEFANMVYKWAKYDTHPF